MDTFDFDDAQAQLHHQARQEAARHRAAEQLRALRLRRAAGEPMDYADEFRLQQLEGAR